MLQLSSKYMYMSVRDDLPSSDTSSTYFIPTNQTFHFLLVSTRKIRGTKSSFTPPSYFQCIYWLPREKESVRNTL